ncbi:flippase [Candidatus Poribacteria bacterium]|nr:flippase [Candidatus Poribacteria bacterium]
MNRIFKNTSSLFSAHLIGRLASLVVTVWLMPRYFTETEFGGYFIAIALTNLVASLTELGMQNPLIREMTLHLDQTRHYLGNALIVRSLLSIIAYAMMLISGIFLYTTEIFLMIVFLGLAEIVNSIAQLYRCVFRAHEEIKYEAFTVVAERGVFFCIGGGAILLNYGLMTVCQVTFAASCINLLLSVGFTRFWFTQLRFQPSRGIVKVLMQQALPFAIGNLFNLLYFRIDAILLSKLSSDGVDANAWYGLAYTIANAFTILPGAFMMGAMFPVLSRAWEREKGRFPSAYTFSMRWMVLTGLPFAVGLSTLSFEIIGVLFPNYTPDEVGKVATTLQWLSWSGGLIFATTAVLAVLRATDKRRAFSVLMGTTALLNICLNLYLMPRFSHVGAAVAMVISEAYVLVVGLGYISRNIVKFREIFPVLPTLLKAVFLSAVMWIGLVLLKGILSVWVLISLAVLFYGGGIAILGEFRERVRFD